ncbi:MAG: response regulator [Nocardioidaceae bacterium]
MQGFVSRALRVYLLDDHDLVRRGLVDLLSSKRDIKVVGDSASAVAAVKSIIELQPDVMVLDVRLQDGSGIEVSRKVRAVEPRIRALMLTASDDDDALVAALLAGAAGYLTKLSASLDVLDTLRAVGAGRSLISPDERNRIGEEFLTGLDNASRQSGRVADELDRLVLRHLIDGRTDSEIAELADLSEPNVVARVRWLLQLLAANLV